MDVVLLAGLTVCTGLVGLAWWQLMVRPEDLLHWMADEEGDEDWFRHHPGAVRALRITAGGLTFTLGFVTGLALIFVARTG